MLEFLGFASGLSLSYGIITTLVNGKIHMQNNNNNNKYCYYTSTLPWALTNWSDHLLIEIKPLVCLNPSALPRDTKSPWVLF